MQISFHCNILTKLGEVFVKVGDNCVIIGDLTLINGGGIGESLDYRGKEEMSIPGGPQKPRKSIKNRSKI